MSLALRYAVRSDRGLTRSNNEDSVYAGPRLLAVADGMGGHVGGAEASRTVIAAISPLDDDNPHGDLISQLREAVEGANADLRQAVAEKPELDGMGTTLTAILFAGSRLGLVHVGDSRGYMMRGDQLSPITRDHTFVQALVDEGRLTAEEASTHPQRSLILQALTGREVEPDISIREARLGDRYLICSDGLSDVVSADTLLEALRIEDPQQAADRLVELALRGGGPDNITCIVADVIDVEYGDDAPVVDGAAGSGDRRRGRLASDSAAARAAAATPSSTDDDDDGDTPDDGDNDDDDGDDDGSSPRRRVRRRVVIGLVVLVVLLGGLFGFYRWTQTQYFVGVQGDRVAVYRGLHVSLVGLRLYHRVDTSSLKRQDLVPVARNQVESGISADSRSQADAILANLLSNQTLPPCPTATPTATPSPTPSGRATRTGRSGRSRPKSTPTRTPSPSPTVPLPTQVRGRDCR